MTHTHTQNILNNTTQVSFDEELSSDFTVGTKVIFGVTKTKRGKTEVMHWAAEGEVASHLAPFRFMAAVCKTGNLTPNHILLKKIKPAAKANQPVKPTKFLKGIIVNPMNGECLNSSPVEFKNIKSYMSEKLIDSIYVEVSCICVMPADEPTDFGDLEESD
jgi:hypothetical protein